MINEIEKREWIKPVIEELSVGKSTEANSWHGKDGGSTNYNYS